MRRNLSRVLRVIVVVTAVSSFPSCGERAGSYVFETVLDESLDNYVHPYRRPELELTPEVPSELKGVEALAGERIRFADLSLGNIGWEHQYLAILDTPGNGEAPIHLVLDRNSDGDLSDESPHPLRPYEEGSPYYLSDDLTVSYTVIVDKEYGDNSVERKISFVLKRTDEGDVLRFNFVGHRAGRFDHLEGEPFGFILFDADLNGFYDHRDLLVIDTNRDGVIDGNRNSVERYGIGEAFFLGERVYRIVGLNPRGIKLSIIRYTGDATPRDRLEVGDVAPDFALKDLSWEEVRLSRFSGKTILLPFWASG
jgi:hypothetical protein